jgi:putative zinc finger protein
MRCEEVRDLLPEHLLGSIDEAADARIRRHLRGCGECRSERLRLEEGVAALSFATHEAVPPELLREHVLGVLQQEWRAPEGSEPPRRQASPAPMWRWLSAVAAALLVVAVAWGAVQTRHAQQTSADAASYQALLATLGGREFRLGELHPTADSSGVSGTVLLYDGVGRWNSWGIVLARSDADLTDARVLLVGPNGDSKELPPLRFSAGEASSWLVTHESLTDYDELVIVGRDGSVLANARIAEA